MLLNNELSSDSGTSSLVLFTAGSLLIGSDSEIGMVSSSSASDSSSSPSSDSSIDGSSVVVVVVEVVVGVEVYLSKGASVE